MYEKKLVPTRICTRLVCKQRFIPAQSVLWHTPIQLHFPVSNFMKIDSISTFYSIDFHENFFNISILKYEFYDFFSLVPFSMYEFHEKLFSISIFKYRISREFVHYFLKLSTERRAVRITRLFPTFGWNGAKIGWMGCSLHKLYRVLWKICGGSFCVTTAIQSNDIYEENITSRSFGLLSESLIMAEHDQRTGSAR